MIDYAKELIINHLYSVIRLGFEPKTHSLEGCCSIQLSYRTDPYVFPFCWKVGAKVVIFF